MVRNDTTLIIIPYIILYYIKLISQFGCFPEKLLTRETTVTDNPDIYHVEGDNSAAQ
jgi:hypothetical protein